jgi:hypothetical protein
VEEDEMLAEDLRATSAQVSATAERLDALENEKRDLEPQDPRVIELSDEIERLAARLRRQTAIEGTLSREIHANATSEPA